MMRRPFRLAALMLLVGAVCALGSYPARAQGEDKLVLKGTVRTPSDPTPRAIDVVRIDGVDYLDLDDVARLFRGTKYWRAELEKMVLKVEGHRVRLTVGSPFVFVDDDGQNLLAPVRWHDGRLVVPVRLATEALDELVTESVTWDRARLQLRLDTGDPNILAVRYDVRRNGTVVEIRLSEPLAGEVVYPRPDRIVVRIPGGVLSEATMGNFPGRGLLDSLVAIQEPGRAALRFHLGPLGGTGELLSRTSPPRLLLAVSEGLPDDIPLPEFDRSGAPGVTPDRDVRVIAIDAGHGGSDTGIISPSGVPEKEITLAIALRLKDLLESDGIQVHLTREEDRFLASQERTESANGAAADVFLSIQGNGWFDSGMHGYSVGMLPDRLGKASGGELPEWGVRSRVMARRTEFLGEVILETMEGSLIARNRGTKRANYAVLEGATMPAVMVECGFLTNFEEGMNLSDPEVHEVYAQTLAAAIFEYRELLREGREGTP